MQSLPSPENNGSSLGLSDQALQAGDGKLRKIIEELCRTDFLVFQKVELGLEIGPQHRVWWSHLRTGDDVVELAPRDHGKPLAHSIPILTSKGWKRHGDLKIGDKVFTPTGDQRIIIGQSKDFQLGWKVAFSNGEEIITHENHEWEVIDRRHSRYGDCVKILETKQLQEQGLYLQGQDQRARWWLPNIQALKFAPKDLPIHPYVLGVWLGDGDKYGRWICQGKEDAAEIFQALEEHLLTEKDYVHKETGVISRVYENLRVEIKANGLEGNKHIPELYQRGSIDQRLELLAGLIDTDGCVEQVTQKGRGYSTQRVRFVNTNETLIGGVEELCRGLGFRVTKSRAGPALSSSGFQGHLPGFTLLITPNLVIPTRLPRKKIEGSRSRELPKIAITAIEPCEPVLGRCIEIDDPRGTYLVGKDLIPTHNSHSLARAYVIWRICYDRWVEEALILGADNSSAVDNLDKLKKLLAESRSWGHLLPSSREKGKPDSRTEVMLTNGKVIKAKGFMSPLRGRHPQLIACDDVLNEKNSMSKDGRSLMLNRFNDVVVPMKDKGTKKARERGMRSQIVVVGTAQDLQDMYHVLLERGYRGAKLKAVIDDETREVLWADRYSYEDLMTLKKRIGVLSFMKEYQNTPMSDETTIFPYSLFQPCFDEKTSYVVNYQGPLEVYLGADFSVPGSLDGDWTVIIVLAYDRKENVFFLLNYWRARPATIQEQLQQLELYCQMFNVTSGYLEDNMFQGIYREHFKRRTTLPLKGHTVNRYNKNSLSTGVLSIRTLLENNLIVLPYQTDADKTKTEYLVSEFTGIKQRKGRIGNETSHDDVVMALWHALESSRGMDFQADF